MAFHAGYMGYAKLGATTIRITGSSLNPVQAINAPDLVQGEYNKRAWNYGAIETGGNITGPLGEVSSVALTDYAWYRETDGDRMLYPIDVDLYFYKATGNSGRKFAGCQVDSYALSITAGDVANFTAEFFGKQVTAIGGSVFNATECEKLITWDRCGLSGWLSGGGALNLEDYIQGWSLNINNNLKRIQRVGQDDLFPVDILAGIRDITGSVTIYADDLNNDLLTTLGVTPYFGADDSSADPTGYVASSVTTLVFEAGPISFNINCNFDRTAANATTDTMQYTANFTGLCNDYTTTPT